MLHSHAMKENIQTVIVSAFILIGATACSPSHTAPSHTAPSNASSAWPAPIPPGQEAVRAALSDVEVEAIGAAFRRLKADRKNATQADGVDYKQALDGLSSAKRRASSLGASQAEIDRKEKNGDRLGVETARTAGIR